MTRENKVILLITLIALTFAAIGYQVRAHLDEQFELLVPRGGEGRGQTDFIGGAFSDAMEGDPVEDQKTASERAKMAEERKKKQAEEQKKKDAAALKEWGEVVPEDCLIPALFSEIKSDADEAGEGKKYEEGASGLHGYYFGDKALESLVLERLDPVIDFNWGNGAPDDKMKADNFSIRWTGWVVPKESGKHRFCALTDDGFRLWIDGKKIGEFWQDRPPMPTFCEVELEAGNRHSIRMDYYENGGGTAATLYWLYGEKLEEREEAEKAELEEKAKAEKKDK